MFNRISFLCDYPGEKKIVRQLLLITICAGSRSGHGISGEKMTNVFCVPVFFLSHASVFAYPVPFDPQGGDSTVRKGIIQYETGGIK